MIAQKRKALDVMYFHILHQEPTKNWVGFFVEKIMKNAKKNVEFVGVVVKVDGKEIVVNENYCSFHGWETECDCCGSHGGCKVTVIIDKKSYDIGLESF
jgi:hypothetical protein